MFQVQVYYMNSVKLGAAERADRRACRQSTPAEFQPQLNLTLVLPYSSVLFLLLIQEDLVFVFQSF